MVMARTVWDLVKNQWNAIPMNVRVSLFIVCILFKFGIAALAQCIFNYKLAHDPHTTLDILRIPGTFNECYFFKET